MFDVLLINGKIVDGTGRSAYQSDLGIKDGKISSIGDLSAASSEKTIDVKGLVVSPGFIDIHTHSDMTHLVDPRAESQIRQGITTEVIGQCGYSLAPRADESRQSTSDRQGNAESGIWCSYAEYLEVMDKAEIATNVVGIVGHGALREAVMGPNQPRLATDTEVADMVNLLKKSLEEGAFGMSTGL